MKKFLLISLVIFGLLGGNVMAQSLNTRLKHLGTYSDWSAYSYQDKDGKVCYVFSNPKKSEGKYTRRGDVFLMITQRPKMKMYDVFNVTAGYIYKSKTEASIKIDAKPAFPLFTYEEQAWTNTSKMDKRLVSAMKSGNIAVVEGTSSRGTLTTDTFSLKGFTKAYNASKKACK
ncbi:MAG: hypothetical protein EOM53_05080 [Alphaproteobacteria bacterium]|nr:hypothetical protein [Alphaproteobacteria bacterium]